MLERLPGGVVLCSRPPLRTSSGTRSSVWQIWTSMRIRRVTWYLTVDRSSCEVGQGRARLYKCKAAHLASAACCINLAGWMGAARGCCARAPSALHAAAAAAPTFGASAVLMPPLRPPFLMRCCTSISTPLLP